MRTRTIPTASVLLAVAALLACPPNLVVSQEQEAEPGKKTKPFVYVPETVSPEFREFLKQLPDPALRPTWPAPDDMDGWKRFHQARETDLEPKVLQVLKRYEPTITGRKLGGVPVLDFKPKGWLDTRKVLVYLHGGAYTMASSRSSLIKSAPAAAATGYRIISVDYTVAPRARWQQVTGEVIEVVQALIKEGHALKDIGMFGDSAGGGLPQGERIKLRPNYCGVLDWVNCTDLRFSGRSPGTRRMAWLLPAWARSRSISPG